VANSALPSNSLTSFEIDRYQNFIIGTHQNGLVIRYKNGLWSNFTTTNSNLPDNHILSTTKDSNDVVWVGTYSKGLVRIQQGETGFIDIEDQNVQVYPNPIQSNSTIFFSKQIQSQRLEIINNSGQIVYFDEQDWQGDSYHLPELKPGFYTLRIASHSSLFSARLALIHNQ
jgi:streptogramin lyase